MAIFRLKRLTNTNPYNKKYNLPQNMVRFVQKQFATFQQVVKKEEGHFLQAIAHRIKLDQKFNYERDCNKHKSDIATFMSKARELRIKNKLETNEIVDYFYKNLNANSLNKMNKRFVQDYNWRPITMAEAQAQREALIEMLNTNNHNELAELLNKKYPL